MNLNYLKMRRYNGGGVFGGGQMPDGTASTFDYSLIGPSAQLLTGGLTAMQFGQDHYANLQKPGMNFSNTGQYASMGAGVGSMIAPGIGTAIGAGVGALGGLTMDLIRRRKDNQLYEQDKQKIKLFDWRDRMHSDYRQADATGVFYQGSGGSMPSSYRAGGQVVVEGGEIGILGKSDGSFETVFRSEGPSHEQGGIRMDVPQGTEIFSRTLTPLVEEAMMNRNWKAIRNRLIPARDKELLAARAGGDIYSTGLTSEEAGKYQAGGTVGPGDAPTKKKPSVSDDPPQLIFDWNTGKVHSLNNNSLAYEKQRAKAIQKATEARESANLEFESAISWDYNHSDWKHVWKTAEKAQALEQKANKYYDWGKKKRDVLASGTPYQEPTYTVPYIEKGEAGILPKYLFGKKTVQKIEDTYNELAGYMNERALTGKMTEEEMELRKRIYNASPNGGYPKKYSPFSIQKFVNAFEKNETLSDYYKNWSKIRTNLFRKYAGLSYDTNKVRPSQYRPTQSKDPNATYYDFDWINDDTKNLMKYYLNKIKQINKSENADFQDFKKFVNDKKDKKQAVTIIPELAHHVTSFGKDDKGEYMSYYDIWDLDFKGMQGGLMGNMSLDAVMNPFEIYGRIYEDEFNREFVSPAKTASKSYQAGGKAGPGDPPQLSFNWKTGQIKRKPAQETYSWSAGERKGELLLSPKYQPSENIDSQYAGAFEKHPVRRDLMMREVTKSDGGKTTQVQPVTSAADAQIKQNEYGWLEKLATKTQSLNPRGSEKDLLTAAEITSVAPLLRLAAVVNRSVKEPSVKSPPEVILNRSLDLLQVAGAIGGIKSAVKGQIPFNELSDKKLTASRNTSTQPPKWISALRQKQVNEIQKAYINEYEKKVQTPLFRERVKAVYGINDDEIVDLFIKETIENIQQPVRVNDAMVPQGANGVYYHLNNISKKNQVPENLHHNSYVKTFAPKEVVVHELGHQRTRADSTLPKWLNKQLLQENKNFVPKSDNDDIGYFFESYYGTPSEFETRLQIAKNYFKDRKIFDHNNPADFGKIDDAVLKYADPNVRTLQALKSFKTTPKAVKDLYQFYKPEFIGNMIKVLPAGAGLFGSRQAINQQSLKTE